MKNCLVYCRVSTEEQADKGYSLDAQEKLCRDFAERNGYSIANVYRDEGKSATNLDRAALQELLSKCTQEGSIDAVFVQETDRLARNTKDHLTIKAILQKAGVKLVSVAQPMLDDSPEGMMIDTILASVNQFQSDINSRKTKRGMQERFEQGWRPGPAPLGYVNVALNGSVDGGRTIRIIEKNPEAWKLIKEGFGLYLTGNYSVDQIGDILYSKGVRSIRGKKIAHSVMINLLKNPFYAGVLNWKGQTRAGRHEAMITKDEHERVLQIIDSHNLHACRRRKHNFLLRGFAFCNICGHRYTGEVHPTKKKSYYHCSIARGHSNRNQNVETSVLEREVEKQFATVQFSDEFTERLIGKLRDVYGEKKDVTYTQKQVLHNQKKAVEARRDKAEEKLFDGLISDDDYSRIKTKFTSELAQIQRQIDELDKLREIDIDVVQEVLKLSRNIKKAYIEAHPELKRQYLGIFWEKFLVQDRKIFKAIPTKLVQALQREQKVIFTSNWLPDPLLYIPLEDHRYMTDLRKRLEMVLGLQFC